MNSGYYTGSSNVPYAFNPGSNHSPAPTPGSASKASAAPDRLIVGVDFGTTYSGRSISIAVRRKIAWNADPYTGVAAVYSATPEDIDIIKTWPGGNGNSFFN